MNTVKIFLLGALMVWFSLSANAQTYLRNYKIETSDQVIGGITAIQAPQGEYTEYQVTTEASLPILFETQITFKIQAVYNNKILVSSSSTIFLNDVVQSTVTCERAGNHYVVVKNGHETKIYEEIEWSAAKLFFNKPENARKVFSETEGLVKNMSSTADEKFILRDPQNSDNTNTYSFSSSQGLHSILFKRQFLPELTITGVRELKIEREEEE